MPLYLRIATCLVGYDYLISNGGKLKTLLLTGCRQGSVRNYQRDLVPAKVEEARDRVSQDADRRLGGKHNTSHSPFAARSPT